MKEGNQPSLVIDCRMINMSGIGTYIKHIVPGVINSGLFDVTCLGKDELNKFEWFKSVKFIRLNSKILSPSEQIELFLKIPQCDIFWAPNWNIPLLPVKAKHVVVTVHDLYHMANADSVSPLIVKIANYFMNFIARKEFEVITVSDFSKSEILKLTKIKRDKVSVIHNGIDKKFSLINAKDEDLDSNYALFVGNVKPHKNLIACIKAFSLIEDKSLKLYIVGKKEGFITNDVEITAAIKSLGDRVVLTGEVSDSQLKNYYKNAKLFLFPSKYEGFGLPILEAMTYNLPIIASHNAAIPEVGGDHIIYFDPKSASDLAKKINGFINGEISCHIDQYPAQLAKFDWDKAVKKHIAIFEDVLK